MKWMIATLCGLGIPLQSAFAASATQNPSQPVPIQFQGDWNNKMKDCNSGNNDSALSVDAHWIRFYESGGPVLAVITMGNNQLSLIARLTSAEDEKTTWDAPMKFELSSNRAVLTDKTSATSDFVRYKCPMHSAYRPEKPR